MQSVPRERPLQAGLYLYVRAFITMAIWLFRRHRLLLTGPFQFDQTLIFKTQSDSVKTQSDSVRRRRPFFIASQVQQVHIARVPFVPDTPDPDLPLVHVLTRHPGPAEHRLIAGLDFRLSNPRTVFSSCWRCERFSKMTGNNSLPT